MRGMKRFFCSLVVCGLVACEGNTGPAGPQGPGGPPGETQPTLGHIEDTRVVFPRTELTVINRTGVLLNLVATDGPVGIRFYKDFGFGNEQQTNPWHMGFIEGVKGYQGLAILRDWLFTAALWDQDGRLIVGRLDPHPPANSPATARFQVRGRVNEVQAIVEAANGQSAEIFQIVGSATQGNPLKHFAVDAAGRTIIGSAAQPQEIILYDTADKTPYSVRITNGQLVVAKVNQ
jgi:hypothetical protein